MVKTVTHMGPVSTMRYGIPMKQRQYHCFNHLIMKSDVDSDYLKPKQSNKSNPIYDINNQENTKIHTLCIDIL